MTAPTPYKCMNCGHTKPVPFETCGECGGGRIKRVDQARGKASASAPKSPPDKSRDLTDIKGKEPPRYKLGLPEVERVFGGGGIVRGARVLIAGPPGIGKSTLLLMLAGAVARSYPTTACSVLYATGEESADRIGSRAHRLGQSVRGCRVIATTQLDDVEEALRRWRPNLAIVDSAPTMTSEADGGGEGTVKQIKIVTRRLGDLCIGMNTTLIVVAHVTKEGIVGGPRALEHLVDFFAMFEGDRRSPIRTLTTIKNRDGAAGESAVLEMDGTGLREVPDAAKAILSERAKGMPGSVIFPAAEADRPTLIEIEAAATATNEIDEHGDPVDRPPRLGSSVSIPSGRIPRMVALLSATVPMSGMTIDVEANGPPGTAFSETPMDLAIVAAIASSALGAPLPDDMVVLGTVSVTGRVKAVHRCRARLEAAMAAGFTRAIVPADNVTRGEIPKGLLVTPVTSVGDLAMFLKGIPVSVRPIRRGPRQADKALQQGIEAIHGAPTIERPGSLQPQQDPS